MMGKIGPFPMVNNLTVGPLKMETSEIFLFSSLISAVDPVAVLAIFNEVSVNVMSSV